MLFLVRASLGLASHGVVIGFRSRAGQWLSGAIVATAGSGACTMRVVSVSHTEQSAAQRAELRMIEQRVNDQEPTIAHGWTRSTAL